VSRPLVGITCYVEPASWGVWRDVRAALLPWGYVEFVERAGGRALVVPPTSYDDDRLLAALDALVIAGGADVEPARYGEAAHPSVQEPRRDRDESELRLVGAAVARDLPLLGVCRGMQVMAVAAGGRLCQHLPDVVGSTVHSPAPGCYGDHEIVLVPGTRLHGLLGDRVSAPSYHHQAVVSHPGYVAAGHAPDGTLEAFEAPGARFRLGVQWHPEAGADDRLFRALVAAAST
jgi:putative glutamine amidotransferase